MARRLVYIASRAHSGSTFLNLLLSAHPRLIGLGEVYSLFDFDAGHINRQDKIRCSCGETMRNCIFWGPTTDQLRERPHLAAHDMYDLVLNAFYDFFGDDCIPIDASKSDEAVQVIGQNTNIDLKVIFLIRDVRPWMISMRNDKERRGDLHFSDLLKRYRLKAPLEYVLRTPVKYFWHWYLLNRKTQRYLATEEIANLQVGYEEISLYPELIIEKIAEFLGLTFDSEKITLGNTQSHIILGNRMRHQTEKRTRIFYDNRWFYLQEWLLPSLLFPNIMKYNIREVYQNTTNHIWQL